MLNRNLTIIISIFSIVFASNWININTFEKETPEFKLVNSDIENSLLEIAKRHEDNVTELLHQIPHWVFPIAAI